MLLGDEALILSKQYTDKKANEPITPKKIEGLQATGNLMPSVEVVMGKQATGSGAKVAIANNANFCYFVLPLEKNEDYVMTYSRFLTLTDADDNVIKYVNGSAYSFNSGDAVKAYVSFNFTIYPVETYVINKGTILNPTTTYKIDWLESSDDTERIHFPSIYYGVRGQKLQIRFDNLPTDKKDLQFQLGGTFAKGAILSEGWEYDSNVNNESFSMTFATYKDYEKIFEESLRVKIAPTVSPSQIEKSALFIGDSTIHSAMAHILSNAETDTNLTLNLIGTRTGSNGVASEGRAGWRTTHFVDSASVNDVINPFYNNGFDYEFYLTNNGFNAPDFVGFNLGTNDTFSAKSDDEVNAVIETALNNLDSMIANVLSVAPDTKIGISVTIPPTGLADNFGNSYGLSQTLWRYERNNQLWVNRLIQHFKGREGIDLIPLNLILDRKTDYLDGVHPNLEIGYPKIGGMLYAWIKVSENMA